MGSWRKRPDTWQMVFTKRGIRKGDHAVMHMGNSIHFVIVLFALFRMGVKPVMMLKYPS